MFKAFLSTNEVTCEPQIITKHEPYIIRQTKSRIEWSHEQLQQRQTQIDHAHRTTQTGGGTRATAGISYHCQFGPVLYS